MNIYRHKEDKKLYTIEHLIHDIHHLNNNASAGIYAETFRWNGKTIKFLSKNHDECKNFVSENFEIVANR